jgi:hypothetical protein
MGIVRTSRERLIRDAYEARLAERERVIQILAEEVEYLRAKAAGSTVTSHAGMAATPLPPMEIPRDLVEEVRRIEIRDQLSEDEEQLDAMKQTGVISEVEYEQALEALRNKRPEDIIE